MNSKPDKKLRYKPNKNQIHIIIYFIYLMFNYIKPNNIFTIITITLTLNFLQKCKQVIGSVHPQFFSEPNPPNFGTFGGDIQ